MRVSMCYHADKILMSKSLVVYLDHTKACTLENIGKEDEIIFIFENLI